MSSLVNKPNPAALDSPAIAKLSLSAMNQLVRSGNANLRERGTFGGNSWRPKRMELDSKHLSLISPNSAKRRRIELSTITQLERTDLAEHSLVVRAAGKRFNISFASDSELYDWQDDIYRHCPLGNYSKPFDFVHKAHVGSNTVSGSLPDPTILPIYAEILGTAPPTNSHRSSGIAIAPRSRPASGAPLLAITATGKASLPTPITTTPTPLVLEGAYLIKQAGFLSGWRWKQRWLSLTSAELIIYRGKAKPTATPTITPSQTIPLKVLSLVEPDEKRPHCLVIEYGQPASAFAIECLLITFSGSMEMYTWRDALMARSGLAAPISGPTNFTHKIHVGFDSISGGFTGLPAEWAALVNPASSQNSAPTTTSAEQRQARRQSRRRSALVEPVA